MLDRAVVYDTRDPLQRGRLRVRIPTKTGQHITGWIWPVVTSGYLVLPNPGDQVWVSYESGDEDFPVWLGKIQVTKAYKQGTSNLGDLSALLKRVADLEKAVTDLGQAVANLTQSKANVGHTHR
jgi:hypothetical protein